MTLCYVSIHDYGLRNRESRNDNLLTDSRVHFIATEMRGFYSLFTLACGVYAERSDFVVVIWGGGKQALRRFWFSWGLKKCFLPIMTTPRLNN